MCDGEREKEVVEKKEEEEKEMKRREERGGRKRRRREGDREGHIEALFQRFLIIFCVRKKLYESPRRACDVGHPMLVLCRANGVLLLRLL